MELIMLQLLGGLGMFVFGMNFMSGGIEKVKVRRQALIQKQMRRSACQLYQKVLVCLDAYAVSKKEICFFVYLGYFL